MRKRVQKVNCVTYFPIPLNQLLQVAQLLKFEAKIY